MLDIQLRQCSNIQVGALVTTQENNGTVRKFYLILPEGGGTEVNTGKQSVTVITPKTPLTAALLGKKKGDTVMFKLPTKTREMLIADVR